MGWVTVEPELHGRPVQRIAVRVVRRMVSGAMASSSRPGAPGRAAFDGWVQASADPKAVLLAYVNFYDQRGGGVDIEIK